VVVAGGSAAVLIAGLSSPGCVARVVVPLGLAGAVASACGRTLMVIVSVNLRVLR
jgi:hypothetical protein